MALLVELCFLSQDDFTSTASDSSGAKNPALSWSNGSDLSVTSCLLFTVGIEIAKGRAF